MGEFFVYSFFAGALLLLAPVFLTARGYADLTKNRIWFSLKLFRICPLAGGYLEFCGEGIVWHRSKTKAVILPYGELAAAGKRFQITKGFQLLRFDRIAEIGGTPNAVAYAAALSILSSVTGAVLRERFAVVQEGRTLLCRGDIFAIAVRATIVCNLLTIMAALTKKCLEGLITWIKNCRLSWKKRRTA